jgi:hypothetical protein
MPPPNLARRVCFWRERRATAAVDRTRRKSIRQPERRHCRKLSSAAGKCCLDRLPENSLIDHCVGCKKPQIEIIFQARVGHTQTDDRFVLLGDHGVYRIGTQRWRRDIFKKRRKFQGEVLKRYNSRSSEYRVRIRLKSILSAFARFSNRARTDAPRFAAFIRLPLFPDTVA